VDGEVEVLLAGEWRAFKEGAQDYAPHALAVTNLTLGKNSNSRSRTGEFGAWNAAVGKGSGRQGRAGGDGQMNTLPRWSAGVPGPFARVHTIIECLVYIGLFAAVLGLGTVAL